MTKAIIFYDQDGLPAGVMDVDYVQSRPALILAAAFHSEDWDDKGDAMMRIIEQIQPDDDDLKITSLVGALAEFLQLVDAMIPIMDLSGVDTRAKLQEIYGKEQS